MKKHEFSIGGVWEGNGFDVEQDYKVVDNYYQPCKHAHSKHEVMSTRGDGSPHYTTAYIIPFVAIQFNEAGHRNTGICAQCISEAIDTIK